MPGEIRPGAGSESERLLRSVVDSLEGRMCIIGDAGVIIGTNRSWDQFADEMEWDDEEAGIGADFFSVIRRLRGELPRPMAEASERSSTGSPARPRSRGTCRWPGGARTSSCGCTRWSATMPAGWWSP